MLTNSAPAETHEHTEISATTIAIEAAERRSRAALRDVARLAAAGEIGVAEAAELEADTLARLMTHIRELELRGAEVVDPALWARYEARAATHRAAAVADGRRSPRLRGLTPRARALRERQMCVVASARVIDDVRQALEVDDDEESLATRLELAAAGLL
jgi:hypothetical protein